MSSSSRAPAPSRTTTARWTRTVWTSIGVNYSTYKPTDEEILTRYLLKFSKGGKATAAELHQDDLGLLDPSGDSEGYLVQAASGAIEL